MLFSADLGNGYIKAITPDNDGTSYPAAIAHVSDMLGDFSLGLSRHSNHNFIIGYNGHKYAIGDTVRLKGLTPVTIAHRSRIGTDYYKVLFASAMASLIWQSDNVRAVVSLPPAAYWDKDKLKATLCGSYKVDLPGIGEVVYKVDKDNLSVIPEGIGMACCLALDENGSDQPGEYLSRSVVGIVDIGTYTTDFILLDGLHIVRASCDSLTHALHDVHKRLIAYCQSQGYDLDHYRADSVLNAGYFMRHGERFDIRQQIEQWTGDLIPAISGMLRTLWNGGDDCDYMLLGGGGAPWIYERMAFEFPQLQIIEHVPPHMANAIGALRWLKLKERTR